MFNVVLAVVAFVFIANIYGSLLFFVPCADFDVIIRHISLGIF